MKKEVYLATNKYRPIHEKREKKKDKYSIFFFWNSLFLTRLNNNT